MSNVNPKVFWLSRDVKTALETLVEHPKLGDEVVNLAMEVSKFSTLISKEPPNAEWKKDGCQSGCNPQACFCVCRVE